MNSVNTQPQPTGPLEISLRDYQILHQQRLLSIYSANWAALDTSQMGRGKTIQVIKLAKDSGRPLIVFAPEATHTMWVRETAKYGVQLLAVITPQSMRGTAQYGINASVNPFLIRQGDSFAPTTAFHNVITNGPGIFLVFDECHNMKNAGTAQLNAAHALVRHIVTTPNASRIHLMSATPIDKPEHTISTMKMLGLIQSEKMYYYNQSTGEYETNGYGLQELYSACYRMDAATTQEIMSKYPVTDKTTKQISAELFTSVVKRFLLSGMPPKPRDENEDYFNGYYNMNPTDVELLRRGEALLRKSLKDQEKKGRGKRGNWADITRALMMIEKSKLNLLVRLANKALTEDPNCKVLIYVSFVNPNEVCNYGSIPYLLAALRQWNPQALYGGVKPAKREEIKKAFQEDSNACRLIIGHPKVGGIGIDLDDKTGNHRRIMFIVPNYNFIDLYQATGRIDRMTTMSRPSIRFVYSKAFTDEMSILNALIRKSQATRSSLAIGSDDILMPGDYPTETEEGDWNPSEEPQVNLPSPSSIPFNPVSPSAAFTFSPSTSTSSSSLSPSFPFSSPSSGYPSSASPSQPSPPVINAFPNALF